MKQQCLSSRFLLGIAIILLVALSVHAQDEVVTLRVLTGSNELTADHIAAFEAENPDIHIEFVENNDVNVELALTTGDVDLMRVPASSLPAYVENGYLLDLTPYFEASEVIHIDDIAAAANYYVFDERYYGLPKDWSLDFSIYIYTPAFEAAGIPLPSTTEPMTYAELAEIASQLTVREGDTVVTHGFNTPDIERLLTLILLQNGTSMFNEDYSEMQLTDNPLAMEVVQFLYDMTLAGDMNYNWDYMAHAWGDGTIPMFQWGYWYGGTVSDTNPMYGHLMAIPAPTWDRSLPRINPTVGPVGMAILASSTHPDEAYRFFEWYMAGAPAVERTSNGWGVPPLVSMMELLPQDTDFNQQRYEVLQSEMPYSDWTMPVYPYRSIWQTFSQSWTDNMLLALDGSIDFETFASNIQEAVNLAILNEQMSGQ